MNQYPVLGIIVRWGGAIAMVVAALVLLAGGYVSFVTGSAAPVVAAVPIALVLGLLLKSYAEIVAVLSDMLIPK